MGICSSPGLPAFCAGGDRRLITSLITLGHKQGRLWGSRNQFGWWWMGGGWVAAPQLGGWRMAGSQLESQNNHEPTYASRKSQLRTYPISQVRANLAKIPKQWESWRTLSHDTLSRCHNVSWTQLFLHGPATNRRLAHVSSCPKSRSR